MGGERNKTVFFIFWRSFLISWRVRAEAWKHVGGAKGAATRWAEGAVAVLGALFFIFWRSFLLSFRKGRHVGGEGGGHGSMWAV